MCIGLVQRLGYSCGRIGQGWVWSQRGMPAALACRTAWVLPGLVPRMNATQPSAPRAIISALRR